MDPLQELRSRLGQLQEQQLLRTRRIVEGPCRPQTTVLGGEGPRPMLAFCSNDYLGLAAHPAVVAGLERGARQLGAGSGASHLISGHHLAHHRLEERLAQLESPHIPGCRALFFGTGYLANIAVLASLADRETEIFSEELNHASLIDGIRMSRARRQVYPHADLATLAARLRASTARRKLIVTDAVFSMDGDLAPLPQLLELAGQHGAWLMVDDAHGFGVLGERGRGSLAHHGLRSEHLVYVGTLGKALGVAGAFVAAHETVIEWLVQRARPYVFSTASPPALAVALEAALDITTGAQGETLRAALAERIARLRAGLAVDPWRLLPSTTAIQPIIIGDNAATMAAAGALQEQGLWVAGIRPPTVPQGSSRLRVTLSAAHAPAQIDQLVAALNALAAQQRDR
ncbi:8-amino-7-oxononanoate synthase [Burkholderiales bacterium]|nr:8-amino-7-oxononanoate synthase [Burkholderiales bacterium]